MSSYPLFNVSGEGVDRLSRTLSLVPETDHDKQIVLGYHISDDGRFVLFKYNHAKMIPFPVPLSLSSLAPMIIEWLKTVNYPREPDHDGDNEKGWIVHRDSWGYIDGYGFGSFCAVKPHWIMYGK